MEGGDFSNLTIKAYDSLILHIPLNIIKTINFFPKHKYNFERQDYPRFFNSTSMGYTFGKLPGMTNSTAFISAEMVNGIAIFPWLQAGIGIGYDQYEESSVVPKVFYIGGDIFNSTFAPFYFIEGGISKAWIADNSYTYYNKSKGLGSYNFGIGFRIYGERRFNLGFSLGYKIQHLVYSNEQPYSSTRSDVTYRRLSLKTVLGF